MDAPPNCSPRKKGIYPNDPLEVDATSPQHEPSRIWTQALSEENKRIYHSTIIIKSQSPSSPPPPNHPLFSHTQNKKIKKTEDRIFYAVMEDLFVTIMQICLMKIYSMGPTCETQMRWKLCGFKGIVMCPRVKS